MAARRSAQATGKERTARERRADRDCVTSAEFWAAEALTPRQKAKRPSDSPAVWAPQKFPKQRPGCGEHEKATQTASRRRTGAQRDSGSSPVGGIELARRKPPGNTAPARDSTCRKGASLGWCTSTRAVHWKTVLLGRLYRVPGREAYLYAVRFRKPPSASSTHVVCAPELMMAHASLFQQERGKTAQLVRRQERGNIPSPESAAPLPFRPPFP